MFPLLSLVIIILYCNLVLGAPVDLETVYAKQIAWTASNIDNGLVSKSFEESFSKLLNDPQQLRQLQTDDGKKILQQGSNLLTVLKLKEKLSKCLFFAEPSAKKVVQALNSAMAVKAMDNNICVGSLDKQKELNSFGRSLENSVKDYAKAEILKTAQKQLEATKFYWENASKVNSVDVAIELTEAVQDDKPPHDGKELLLYTQAIQRRKHRSYVGTADVEKAFSEVQSELKNHEEYLQSVSKETPEEALQKLIVSNPAATAQFLMESPESFNIICKALTSYDFKAKRQQLRDKAIFWGGLVVGGALLLSGGMAGAAFLVPEIGGAASTLTAVAARTAVAGTVTSTGENLYESSKAYQSYIEAKNIRASSFAEDLSVNSIKHANKAEQEAYADLAEAGFATATIVPFGSGFNVMKKTVQRARSNSFGKIAKDANKIEAESIKLVALTLKEISADKEALKVLEESAKKVNPDEMGSFLGYLSDFSSEQKKHILELIKQKPQKASEAIRESSRVQGVCR
ncbi:MAG: tolA protein [Bdellovibrio sp.]